MAIKIDVPELVEILKITPPEQNIMLIGKHGIGKSQIITGFYQKKKMKVIAFFLGQMSDPGDLIGLMYKDEKTGHSDFLPPYWWPVDNKPIVLFLDELNRARPEILQSVQDLTLNKTLAGKQLPEGSIVLSAVNEGDEYQLTDLDPALVSRFNLYEFAPTVEDWLLWANEKGLDERVTAFIQKNHHFLDPEDFFNSQDGLSVSSGLNKTPDRRAWEKVSHLIKPIDEIGDIHVKIIAGIVGVKAAISFKKSLGTTLKVSPEQLLLTFSKYKGKLKPFKLKEFIFLNEQVIYWLNGDNYKPRQKKTVLKNFHQYILYLKMVKQTEAIAHIASMIENERFQKLAGLLLVDSEEIGTELFEYIANIKL
ncbi:AAA family ATPase [Candidatus Parabeggiatoa sp. HSG14]|uniref:AAA family ATPase n=1 Tax=Candidatus Parabeggiatoa sp. HSG14 TaxID=3055593 RepID=UPI0025A775E6|nr:AAA family ATPase [Thiotrichales bacterium HSG14]